MYNYVSLTLNHADACNHVYFFSLLGSDPLNEYTIVDWFIRSFSCQLIFGFLVAVVLLLQIVLLWTWSEMLLLANLVGIKIVFENQRDGVSLIGIRIFLYVY